jgi:intraflagellar transport protein 140
MALALQSSHDVMLETAEYFVEQGSLDKAVTLFHKGGATSKALDMCFQGQLFDDLQVIADDLGDGQDADPEVLQQCAEFFMQHGQYDKAVSLLLAAQQHEEALTLCTEHRVAITEEMAESLTLPKYPLGASPMKNAASAAGGDRPPPAAWTDRRNTLLVQLGETLERQGDFRLAARKFTQAGDKMRAMKALLRSGDTEKIVFFTNLAKSKEIYVLAANYLQSLDWHSQPKLMKSIVQFYGRARAYGSLAMFYDSCAAMEMNEFRNYETALGALQEAAKYSVKMKSGDNETTQSMLQRKVEVVKQFVQARQLAKSDPQQMVDICIQLTQDASVEQVLRVGDVYAVLVEWSFMQRDMATAHKYLQEMDTRGLDMESFVEGRVVDAVFEAVGATRSRESEELGIDEDIKEDF